MDVPHATAINGPHTHALYCARGGFSPHFSHFHFIPSRMDSYKVARYYREMCLSDMFSLSGPTVITFSASVCRPTTRQPSRENVLQVVHRCVSVPDSQMEVRLSGLRTGSSLLPRNINVMFLVLISGPVTGIALFYGDGVCFL
jgi:hypothetical protein